MLKLFFLSVLLAFPALACELPADYQPIADRAPKALLYEATHCDGKRHYLFGTYHSDSPALQPIIEHITPYIWQSERLWVELVSSPELLVKTRRFLMLPADSPNLQSLIGDALFAQTRDILAPMLQIPEPILQGFKPWAPALLVQYPAPQADGIILDVKLQHLAARKAIGVSSLERPEQQFGVFLEMPKTIQIDFLKSTLQSLYDLQGVIQTLESHYIQGDIAAIERLSREQFDQLAQIYPELAAYLELKLIDTRNRQMADTIDSKAQNKHFIAMGALHLPGKNGILALLEGKGWRIQPVPR
jgi:uncharacterized protein YbaP (TraB family)